MSRPAAMWHATVLRGGLEAAIVDKYPDLFASDPVLAQAWADHQAAEARIHERMDALAQQSATLAAPNTTGDV